MQFRKFVENIEYDQLLKWANQIEGRAMQHTDVKGEFRQTGTVTMRTLQQALGISEGEAAFLQRYLEKKHHDPIAAQRHKKKQDAEYQATLVDDYYYHVTTADRLPDIQKKGLQVGQAATFSNYVAHSKNRLFLTEKGGISFWKMQVELHATANDYHSSPAPIIVLRIPKSAVKDIKPDEVGSRDARYPSYYTTQRISPDQVEVM